MLFRMIVDVADRMRSYDKSHDSEIVWNNHTVQLVQAAKVYYNIYTQPMHELYSQSAQTAAMQISGNTYHTKELFLIWVMAYTHKYKIVPVHFGYKNVFFFFRHILCT